MGGIFYCIDNKIIESSFIKKAEIVMREEKFSNYKLIQETKRSLFKIKIKDAFFKQGFFCNISLKEKGENETMNSIFINNYLINGNDDLFGNEIELYLNNDEKISIQINKSRKMYINKKFKISIIEINKEEKDFSDIPFLEIENENDIKKDKINVYLLYFKDNNIVNISDGEINNISDNNFIHTCQYNDNSNYEPIINSINNKIIGIHYKYENGQNSYNGILIKYLLNELEEFNFNNLNKKKCIKSILLSFYKIEKLKSFFFQEEINVNNKTKELTNLIAKYMKDYEKNNSDNCDKVIIDIEKKIDLKDLKFENLIIYILRALHQELNSKIISNNPPPLDDTDEKISYNNFLKYYNEQNESIIKNLFFGFKEITKLYQCCSIMKYKFEVCEYINFDLNENKDLQNLMTEWENHQNEGEDKCSMCLISSTTLTQYQLYYSPEILIIINNNKIEVQLNSIIKTKKYEYKLISCIIESKEPTDFSVIFNDQNKWQIIENDNIDEFNNNNKIYPYVLFCQKIKEINNNESKITLLTEISRSNDEKKNNNANIIKENNIFGLNNFDNNENNNNSNHNMSNNNNININNSINIYNNIEINNNINNVNNSTNNNMINNNSISTNNNPSNMFVNNLNNVNKINQNKNMRIKYSIYQKNNISNIRLNNSMNMILSNNQILNNKNQIYHSYNQNNNMNNYYNNIFNQRKNKINYNCNNIMMNNNNSINNIYPYNNYNINMFQNFMGINNFQNNNNYINNKLNSINNNDNINGGKNIITLLFNIANKKTIFIDINNKSMIFSDAIKELKSKYLWLDKINISHFNYNGVKISENKTIKDNNLENNSMIEVVVYNL